MGHRVWIDVASEYAAHVRIDGLWFDIRFAGWCGCRCSGETFVGNRAKQGFLLLRIHCVLHDRVCYRLQRVVQAFQTLFRKPRLVLRRLEVKKQLPNRPGLRGDRHGGLVAGVLLARFVLEAKAVGR